jgi:hypothetical protein
MNLPFSDAGRFRNFTASTTLVAGTGKLKLTGIFVASSTAGTLALPRVAVTSLSQLVA